MEKVYKILIAAASVFIVILLIALAFLYIKSDRKGPDITFSGENIAYDGMNDRLLLRDVTAIDEIDGDVTDTLRIKTVMETDDGYIVVYLAKDLSNNITEYSRHILASEN